MSTITIHKCDQCGKEERYEPVRWYDLSAHGIDLMVLGEVPLPVTLCSMACLAAWATVKAEKAKA